MEKDAEESDFEIVQDEDQPMLDIEASAPLREGFVEIPNFTEIEQDPNNSLRTSIFDPIDSVEMPIFEPQIKIETPTLKEHACELCGKRFRTKIRHVAFRERRNLHVCNL